MDTTELEKIMGDTWAKHQKRVAEDNDRVNACPRIRVSTSLIGQNLSAHGSKEDLKIVELIAKRDGFEKVGRVEKVFMQDYYRLGLFRRWNFEIPGVTYQEAGRSLKKLEPLATEYQEKLLGVFSPRQDFVKEEI